MAVTIKTDRARIAARIKAGARKMVFAVSEQALSDCNEFVRVDQGQLRNSSYTASDTEKGELVWDTPYAKRVYFTGTPSKDANPNASLQWCEKAHDTYGEDWNRIAQKNFDEGMGQ